MIRPLRNELVFEIPGIPSAHQSMRVAVLPNGRIHKYQPRQIVAKKETLVWTIKQQLPQGFRIWTGAISVDCLKFTFPPVKTVLKRVQDGEIVFKSTKPDLGDNLQKMLWDAMQGIVFVNDSQICRIRECSKIYGMDVGISVCLKHFT